MIAFRTVSRRAPRLIEAKPTSRLGVPPMRSRVQNEKPHSLALSRASLTRTHSSRCFDSSPTSYPAGPSVQMSAISPNSASPSAVQSLVSTTIAITRELSLRDRLWGAS